MRHPAVPALATGAVVLAALLGGCGGSGSQSSTSSFPGGFAVPAKPAPPIELTDYRGHKVKLAKLKGRPVFVAFLYTHCTDLCPIVAGKVHTAYARLPKGKRPVFLAVSVDPAHDTPASATLFDRRHRTTGEIDWLLGSRPELEKVWKAWGVKPQHNAKNPEEIEHSAEIFAVDPQGRIRARYQPNFKPAGLAAGSELLASL
jgi:protein SCO1/2